MAVWLCSGQGAQKPGMGSDLLDIVEVADVFEEMSQVLGRDLAKLACEGTDEEVNDPAAAQALTMAVSVGVGQALFARGFRPSAMIGFSLGQISALALTGMLSLHDATELLRVRSSSMASVCASTDGGMVALMGATLDDAERICAESADGEILVCANHNAPGQIVISGANSALERAQELWKEAGKRSRRLATAGAFHSPMMSPAADDVRDFCTGLDFSEPEVTLICNTDAEPFLIEEASERLGRQVESGVLFEQSVRALLDTGEREFVEVGFGGVLVNLVKRIDKETERFAVGNREQFDEFISRG